MGRSTALKVAAALLLLAALAAVNMLVIWYSERSEEETRLMFRDCMAKTKKYRYIDEEAHWYAVFKENRRRFDKENAAGLRLTHLGLNVFADLTNEELLSMHTGCVDHQNLAADNKDRPYPISWSDKGTGGPGEAVSSVLNNIEHTGGGAHCSGEQIKTHMQPPIIVHPA
ncbi:hypothetical protein C2845_PM17G10080 [Panicum miliaceum]|uniref:Cathepsin propeptide inhibitor domain-containing protein n=1 Tax=Panicum miliaceum TaxID=4540 RepID=A0A3L6PZJ5_PANMI|nr:hypothetical protein C2845_PM17G10080 [Panicum miliaceum]